MGQKAGVDPDATTPNVPSQDSTAATAASSTTLSSQTTDPMTGQAGASSHAPPASANNLPPEAVALAARLFDMARTGDTAALTQYLDAGIPKNLTDANGNTLLMLAAYHGQVDAVRALIERGADVNAENDRGQRIIAGAVFKGYDEVVKELFAAGAEIHTGQPNAVDCARMFKKTELLRLFGVDEVDPNRPVPGVVA